MKEHDEALETVLRTELKRSGERWSKTIAELNDKDRMAVLGRMAARRMVGAERNRIAQEREGDDAFDYDREIAETNTPLGSGTGGGRRVVRGTKSLS